MSRIIIKATNMELTDEVREYVEKRSSSLEKYLADTDLVHVEVGQMTKHKRGEIFRAEIRFAYQGRQLYATAEKEDIFSAIDEAKDQIVRETTSMKTRLHKKLRHGAKRFKEMAQGWYGGKK